MHLSRIFGTRRMCTCVRSVARSTVISMLPQNIGPTKRVSLPGRGILQVRDIPGPGPVLILLHGFSVTGDLNWSKHYEALTKHYRVICYDHHGHGSGIRLRKKFTLMDAADDVIRVADALGIDKFTPVGYSMGGALAQLVALRHPTRINGVVLVATGTSFVNSRYGSNVFSHLINFAKLSRYSPKIVSNALARKMYRSMLPANLDLGVLSQLLDHDWATLAWAGVDIGRFDSTPFTGKLDTRVAVIITTEDITVTTLEQHRLFSLLQCDKKMFPVSGDHQSIYTTPTIFGPVLIAACAYACV